MIKTFISLVCGIILGIGANAQSHLRGIYLTQLDFESKKLTYSTGDPKDRNKIRFNELFGKPYITIRHNGEKIILFKDEIFAYGKKDNIVRTRGLISYNFIEQGVIWIYSRDISISEGKGIRRERKYYYSVSGKDEIIPLTVYNLKKSFPEKYLFHNFLDAQFKSDSDLASYNSFTNKFQVNHLLETTIFRTVNAIP